MSYKKNSQHKQNNKSIYANMKNIKSRKELQGICKKNGIRANISSKDMIECIELVISNKRIPDKFRKRTWFELNKDIILTTITLTSLAVTVATLFGFFKRVR